MVAATLSVTLGCEKQTPDISLDELARRPAAYDGHRVSATGELGYHPTPPHYWIESTAGARVEVIGLQEPVFVPGAEMRVTGVFRYSRERGRLIEVDSHELRY